MDFTFKTHKKIIIALQQRDYAFCSLVDYFQNPKEQVVVLRHDVEARYPNALKMARMEQAMGIRGSYYFRILNGNFQRDIIAQVAHMGHEIGYHYDDLSHCKGNHEQAIRRFEKNLNMLREIAPVHTICMEGAPLSRHDNRDLWRHYDYRDYGIIGEPYFDVDFDKVFYLTDTGRRWDGDSVSVRDKVAVSRSGFSPGGKSAFGAPSSGSANPARTDANEHTGRLRFRHTKDIIRAAEQDLLPDQIMITIHPQRWTNKPLPWLRELLWQNAKNVIKAYHVRMQQRTKHKNND